MAYTTKDTMGVTADDIKRAILGGGDVSAFMPALRQALGSPPVSGVPSLEATPSLPEATILLGCIDKDMSSLLEAWLGGKEYQGLPAGNVNPTVVGLPSYGRNIGSYIEHIMDEVEPDIVAIGIAPMGLSTNMLYAFGMPCAVGLPIYGEALDKENRQLCASETFYPGNMSQTAIIKCWLAKVPLIPVGMPSKPRLSPQRTIDENYLDEETRKSNLLVSYHTFDESLENMPHLQEGIEISSRIGQICSNLSNTIGSGTNEKLIEEAIYIASRIMEVASFAHSRGIKAKLLAIVDIKHYINVQYAIRLLKQGITDEVYLPPERDVSATAMVMVSKHSAKLAEYAQEHTPKTTPAQELFRDELEKLSQAKENEQLPEGEVDNLITAIVRRTREHPDIVRGASVRGTIAFKEVLQSFKEMQSGLTRNSIEKAAMITLPPRISTKQGDNESAVAIVSDTVKEVLYGIQFSKARMETILPGEMDWLSLKDIIANLQNLNPAQLSQEQKNELTRKGQVAVIPDNDSLQELSEYLASKDSLPEGKENQYHFTKKAIEYLMEELGQKLMRGEITEDEYHREKNKLEEMLSAASQLQSQMSNKELSETVMELMDAQDKQWQKKGEFQQMWIYYHIKSTREGKQLSPPKRGYYGLKVLIDYLEKRGILRTATAGKSFTLTSEALDTLLEYLIPLAHRGRELKSMIDSGKTQASERKHDIRRYCLGDVFRDISVRHTLREIARQKKKLADIDRRDFRVFVKQPSRLQSDIVLCVDSSGSMGYRYKLTYARLAAAALARAAVGKGDRVGVVTFDNFGRTIMPLTNKKEEIINYIVGISAGGNTNIGDGIKCATELLLRKPSRNQKYTVLITDGLPSAITEKAFAQLRPMKEKNLTEEYAILETSRASSSGIKTSVIHIADSNEIGEGFVKNLARVGKGQVRRIRSLADIKAITQ